ncbi:Hypothetical protein P9211_14441 [Prochlorococcus marinus str. MIT 9211]|uniref:Uncharacterized protein n=1 Tax=Prochlorococcus marinus (strain MIT 9211) TaxID=93059 RepID=A9BC13_PROM4|nr:Hypothetical protein P9211_14441 [Prochlorococcus marinus str. MIT 9211]
MDFQDKLMIGALVFLGISGAYYIWLWFSGFIRESRASDPVKQPWE